MTSSVLIVPLAVSSTVKVSSVLVSTVYSPLVALPKLVVNESVLIWVPEPVEGDTRQFLKDSPMIDTLGLTLKGNTS